MSKQESKYKVTPEERALIEKAANGDGAAFEQLYKNNFRFIVFIARRYFKDENGFEDVVQDVVISMWSGIRGLKDPNSFRSWLYVLIKNECISHIRKEQRHEPGKDDDDEVLMQIAEGRREYIPEDNLEKNETDEFLAAAITELPPGYQRMIRMYYYEERGYQEIADELKISVKTVGSNLTKAKRMLKKMLAKRKTNIDELISHALFAVGADAAISGMNVPQLMHLCDAKIAAAAVTQIGAGASGGGTAVGAGIYAGSKVVAAIIVCVLVAIGGGAAVVHTANEMVVAAPESVTVVTDEVFAPEAIAHPDVAIVLAGSDSKFPDGVNPGAAELITDKGEAVSWRITSESGTAVLSGAGSHIGAGFETLAPGNYTIVWEINGDRWRSTAKREIKII
ncbi:hypothetical protein AGMMS49983_03020 [Clostridia bacterium]|nr:hypothetical protein AGMMS49983_03020 [Clostridia bacterium]